MQQLMLKKDVKAMGELLHDDLVFFDWDGNTIDKQENIASYASDVIHFTEFEFVETSVMRLYGETAIVVAEAQVKGTFQGSPFACFSRYLHVWLFQEERWQIVVGNVRMGA